MTIKLPQSCSGDECVRRSTGTSHELEIIPTNALRQAAGEEHREDLDTNEDSGHDDKAQRVLLQRVDEIRLAGRGGVGREALS